VRSWLDGRLRVVGPYDGKSMEDVRWRGSKAVRRGKDMARGGHKSGGLVRRYAGLVQMHRIGCLCEMMYVMVADSQVTTDFGPWNTFYSRG
jgi:hypothetical protein